MTLQLVAPPEAVPESDFPCTLFQQGMLPHVERLGAALNASFRFRLTGPIREAAVEKGLQALVDRHEILRTSFVEGPEGWLQRVSATARLPFSFLDLCKLDPDARQRFVEAVGLKEAQTAFDVEQAPLVRALLLRTTTDTAILTLTFHSLAVDGWSVGILIREFGVALQGLEAGKTAALSPVDLHHSDYALWQKALVESGALEGSHAFWERKLEGVPWFQVPPDTAPGPRAQRVADLWSETLPRSVSDAWEALARKRGITTFQLGVAALALTLRQATGRDEVVAACQVVARDSVEAEQVVGPLLNTLVLRLPTAGDKSVGDVIDAISNVVSDALAHQDCPIEDVVALGPDSPYPVASVGFVMKKALTDDSYGKGPAAGRLSIDSLPSHSCGALWDLHFFMVERKEGWRITVEANADLYAPETVARLLANWREVLTNVVVAPDLHLAPHTDPAPHPPLDRSALPKPAISIKRREISPAANAAMRVLELTGPGTETPIAVVSLGGVFRRLAEGMPNRRFLDLQFFGPINPPSVAPTVDDYAEEGLNLLREVAPKGPYVIAGECFAGSTIALEIARKLQQQGETVEKFVIFDGWAPGYREVMPKWVQGYRTFRLRFARWRRGVTPAREVFLPARFWPSGPPPPEPTDEELKTRQYLWRLLEAAAVHRPQPFSCDALLFRCAEVLTGPGFRYDMGWRKIVQGPLEIVPLPVNHTNIYNEQGASAILGALTRSLPYPREQTRDRGA